MSRAQSPSRDQTVTMNILAEKVLALTDALQDLKNRTEGMRMNWDQHYQEEPRRPETPENYEPKIKTYERALHLIPEFDGSNVETFIGYVQIAAKQLVPDQQELLLYGIVAQKLLGRAKGTIRADAVRNLPQLFEKLRFLFGRALNLSALEVQRDTCIQRQHETVDFITRFLKIHDEIIAAINSQSTGIASICIQEELYQQKAIEIFRRNVKTEIGDHLYSFELNTLNQAFSKARAFEGELQLRKMRMQRNETFKKPVHQKPMINMRYQVKECTYCQKRGHEERECRRKAFHQQRGQNFHGGVSTSQPPDQASRPSHAIGQNQDHRSSSSTTRGPEARTSEHHELD